MKAVIMAGGLGTRIKKANDELPKCLIPINGVPILKHQILKLKEYEIDEIYLILGYLSEKIIDYIGDGAQFDISIKYIVEAEPLGTAGSLYYLKDKIKEDFLLLNGDIYFDINLERFTRFHFKSKATISIIAHPSSHPYDSLLIETDENGKVIQFKHKEQNRDDYFKNLTNSGLHLISPIVLDYFKEAKRTDLDRDIISAYIKTETVYAYCTSEYIKDMGTPERLYQVSNDVLMHIPERMNLKNYQKCIFLDRDGTINQSNGFISTPKDFMIIPCAFEAIRKINESDYLCIVITNQPVIARGECTVGMLNLIHKKMETELGSKGCYINALYYCPHHPDKGFPGEIESLKIDCDCRKPKSGLFRMAQADFNIDFKASYMIGDNDIDIYAARELGITGYKIGGNDTGYCGTDILDCVNQIL